MMYSKYFDFAFPVSSETIVRYCAPCGFGRAAVTSRPFTEAVRPTYWTAEFPLAGATAEPPAHAEHRASAISAAACLTKPVGFMNGTPFPDVSLIELMAPTLPAIR